MTTALKHLLKRTREKNIPAANARQLAPSSLGEPFGGPVVIRLATARDRRSLERLAALDSAEVPSGVTLIANLRERPVVAVSLSDGSAVADPFVATSDVLELLRLRARQLASIRTSG